VIRCSRRQAAGVATNMRPAGVQRRVKVAGLSRRVDKVVDESVLLHLLEL
jgi:hypothetical protein